MTLPLVAHTSNEVRYYLMVTACARCGHGPWILQQDPVVDFAAGAVTARARCKTCSLEREFSFQCSPPPRPADAEGESINPIGEPSRIIDLGQWLSLFYLLLESASAETLPPAVRRQEYRAALCLSEALKFYEQDELPPASAFFAQASREAFHEHPENFAQQKLRDMLSRLPSLTSLAGKADRDDHARNARWWRFWKR